MPTETIRFPGRQGRELAARLDTPAEAPRAYALFAHCFTCSKDSKAAAYVAQALAARGIATLRFDFSSLEFSSNLEDLLAATRTKAVRLLPGSDQYVLGPGTDDGHVVAAARRASAMRI